MKKAHAAELSSSQYLPDVLIDKLCARLGCRSYSELGRVIGVSPALLSRVRRRRLVVSAEVLLRIHDATGIPIRELRAWMGDSRPHFSPLPLSLIVQPTLSSPGRDISANRNPVSLSHAVGMPTHASVM